VSDLQLLAAAPGCRIELDDDGVVHVHAGPLSLRLAPWLAELADCPLRDVVARLPRDETSLDIAALAALLWSLVRRRQPALMAVLARMVREAERLIAADAGRRACPRHVADAVVVRGHRA
jgi:hypothetical protein